MKRVIVKLIYWKSNILIFYCCDSNAMVRKEVFSLFNEGDSVIWIVLDHLLCLVSVFFLFVWRFHIVLLRSVCVSLVACVILIVFGHMLCLVSFSFWLVWRFHIVPVRSVWLVWSELFSIICKAWFLCFGVHEDLILFQFV